MRVDAVSSTASSTARSEMMAVWRMSMTQRLSREMSERISGHRDHNSKPLKVEPAAHVVISQQAWEVAKKQQ